MPPTTLWLAWQTTAAARPGAPAVIEARDGSVCTRRELTAAAALAAGAPPAVSRGQVAAFAHGNGVGWLAAFLALQKLGLAALPLDPSLPAARRADAAALLGARWLLDDGGRWHALAGEPPPGMDGEICLVKTTSGSTGEPRPLAFTSANMLADGRQIAASMGIGPDDRNLGAIPFGHSYGLGNLVLPLIAQGTAVIASTEILPDALAAQIERFGATVLPSVPAVLRALAESSVDAPRLRSLRRIISAGAPLRADVADGVPGTKFHRPIQNFYGSSETGGICFDRTGEATATGRSIGAPLEGVNVWLDEEGHVTVRGAAVVAPGEHTLADLGRVERTGRIAVSTGRATCRWRTSAARRFRRWKSSGCCAGWKESPTRGWACRRVHRVGEIFCWPPSRRNGHAKTCASTLTGRLPAWQVPRRWWVTPCLPRTERG